MTQPSVPQAFAAALDGLVPQLRQDRSILAAILCGSLSHDTVWARSDIDRYILAGLERGNGLGRRPGSRLKRANKGLRIEA